jgi:F0F1-type ATP synthase assembly protein I
MSKASSRQSAIRIFAIPALVALASGAGLAGALVGDGVSDTFASALVALPAAIFCVCLARRRGR